MAKAAAEQKGPSAIRRILVKITSIEGIEEAAFELFSGLLNILTGSNGEGKTTAARAMARALGGKVDDLEMRDGAVLGTVQIAEGDVSTDLVLGGSGRVRTKGEAPITVADTGALTSLITGDNMLERKTRLPRRLAAFLKIVRPSVDAEAVKILCERDAEMVAWTKERMDAGAIPPDLLSVAEAVKVELQRRAREDFEKIAGSYAGEEAANLRRAAELEAQFAEVTEGGPLLVTDLPSAEAAVERLAAEHDRATTSAAERERQEADRAAIREAGAPRPDVDGALAAATELDDLHKAQSQVIGDLDVKLARQQAEIEATARELESARVNARDVYVRGRAAVDFWRKLQGEAQAWDEQQALLASPATGATAEEVEGARQRLEAARSTRDAARLSGEIAAAKAAAEEAKATGGKLAERGAELRSWSLSIRDRVADLLAKSGAEGFTVVDGALQFEGQDFDSRLSEGQQRAAAIGLAAKLWSGFVFIEGRYFSTLDFEHRAELVRFCESRPDLVVCTEEPSRNAPAVPLQLVAAGGAA